MMNNLISNYGEELLLNGKALTNQFNSSNNQVSYVRDYMVKPKITLPNSITDWKKTEQKSVVIQNGVYWNENY